MGRIDFRYYDGTTTILAKAGDTLNAANATILVVDEEGVNVDLSGYDSGTLLVKHKLSDADVDAVLSFDSAESELTLQDGSYILLKAASDMDVPPKAYAFELKVISGVIEITADEGTFTIDP